MKLLSILLLLFLSFQILSAQGALEGKVTDKETGEEMIGANVVVTLGDVFIAGIVTDWEGNYRLVLEPGTYDLEVSYQGYSSILIEKVKVISYYKKKLDISIEYEQPFGDRYYDEPFPWDDPYETTSGYIFRVGDIHFRSIRSTRKND